MNRPRMASDPMAARPLLVPFLGPFGVPAETFEGPAVARLFGEDWGLTEDGWPRQAMGGSH
jgi:hypothetical protein